MDDESKPVPEPPPQPASREEALARKAADLVKAARPRLKRLIAIGRPRAELATAAAARYVREHEPEIKQAAAKLARSRLPGPLGFIASSLMKGPAPVPEQQGTKCPACATLNPARARFCSECGQRLASADEPGKTV